jgi:hypothetical protein
LKRKNCNKRLVPARSTSARGLAPNSPTFHSAKLNHRLSNRVTMLSHILFILTRPHALFEDIHEWQEPICIAFRLLQMTNPSFQGLFSQGLFSSLPMPRASMRTGR